MNSRSRDEERLHALQGLAGHTTSAVTGGIAAGDFVAVPRLNGTRTGDTLAAKGQPVVVLPAELPPPALQVAVKPATRADDDKLMSALQRLCDEDPSLTVTRDDETHQTILGVSGEVHLAVTFERLDRKCNVHVEREDLRIPYRETITRAAAAEGKHKKQSGGHGQFGVAHLRVEPLPRGSGFVFHDEVVGGAIPRQYIPAVEKGVLETFASGGVYGFPVVDIAVTVDDGKAHSVDSNEVSFKMAAALAVKTAMAEAGPIVLEPVSRLSVTIPDECQGDVLGDLSSRTRPDRRDGPRGSRRLPDRDGDGADGRDHPLRRGPAGLDGWPGHVRRDLRPLRPGPGAHAVVDSQGGGVARRLRASSGRQKTCWKRTGSLARISVPKRSLPGTATTATASFPASRPSGLETEPVVKDPL